MIELVRNCSHGSEIATYRDDGDDRVLLKAATSPEGIRNLRQELAGWEWYSGRLPPNGPVPRAAVVREGPLYLKIMIDLIEGSHPDLGRGMSFNAHLLELSILHYIEIWPDPGGLLPLHGDLSIDNTILSPDGIRFTDWEHFTPEAAPWGFDALNLLFESLWFDMAGRSRPSRRAMALVARNISTLSVGGRLPDEMVRSPLRFLVDFIQTRAFLWGGQLDAFSRKLPILGFSEAGVAEIDETIRGFLGIISPGARGPYSGPEVRKSPS